MSRGASSSSCNSWVHRTCNSCHGGSRVSGSPPICDCGDIAVVRTARTTKNLGKQFWGCANFKVCFPVFDFGCFFHFHLHVFVVLQRCGEDVLGCNFFKWCYQEGADERDASAMNTFSPPQRLYKDERKPWMPEIDLKGVIPEFHRATKKSPIRPPNPQFDINNPKPNLIQLKP